MDNLLEKFFCLRQGESKNVFLLGFVLFCSAVTQQISEITAVSNFLYTGGVNQILIVWFVDSLILLLTTGFQSLLIDRFSRIRFLISILFCFSAAFFLLRLLFITGAPEWLNYALLFILSQQEWLLLPIVLWVLASDIFNPAQAKRIFPVIASGETAGILFGTGVAAIAPNFIKSIPGARIEDLLLLNGMIYLSASLVALAGLRSIKIRASTCKHEGVRETIMEGISFIREVPVFRFLSLSILAMLVADTILEFNFLAITNSIIVNDPGGYQTFYSIYHLTLRITTMLILAFLTSRVIARFQLKNMFFFEPAGAILSALTAAIFPSLGGALGSIFFLKLPRHTMGNPSRKAFQSLVPEERRGRVSMFMDSYLFSLGTMSGCLMAGLLIFTGGRSFSLIYLGMAILAGLVAFWFAFYVRKVYGSSLLNWRLKRRQRSDSIFKKIEL